MLVPVPRHALNCATRPVRTQGQFGSSCVRATDEALVGDHDAGYVVWCNLCAYVLDSVTGSEHSRRKMFFQCRVTTLSSLRHLMEGMFPRRNSA